MLEQIIIGLFCFAMGGLFTLIVCHRDIFKYRDISNIDAEMLRTIIFEKQRSMDDGKTDILFSGFYPDGHRNLGNDRSYSQIHNLGEFPLLEDKGKK